MTDHAVLIAGGGPTGLMLAGELALAGADVAAPVGVLIRPDGYVGWVKDGTLQGLTEALTTWFGAGTTR